MGGWCRNASMENGGSHITDRGLVVELSRFFKHKTVGSFGDGPGLYKKHLLELKEVASYDAYDGAPYCHETSHGRVVFLDLTVPQYDIPLYDWILSLEVAEHIPRAYESVYLSNLFRHAREGIVLSWAVPGQGGLSHVNNRPLEYVNGIMTRNGFEMDVNSSQKLQKASTYSWLKQNIFVYRRLKFDGELFSLEILNLNK